MSLWHNFWGHLGTVSKHRFLVFRYCCRVGLYWQGLWHDFSKFAPVEFWAGVKYYQGEMLVGGGIFLLITLIGGLIMGKEAMGFGDVKLMIGLGLIFGTESTVVITLFSFLIGAILSIILLAFKIKKTDEYIPFGPFIVISVFLSIFIPFETLKEILMQIFTLGMFNRN